MALGAKLSGLDRTEKTSPPDDQNCLRWSIPSPAVLSRRTSSFFALIYLDNASNLRVEESLGTQDPVHTFFTPDLRDRFLRLVGAYTETDYQRPGASVSVNSDFQTGTGNDDASFRHDVRYREGDEDMPFRRVRRRIESERRLTQDLQNITPISESAVQETTTHLNNNNPTIEKIALEIGNEAKVKLFYETALKHFQQLNCRQMAKAFIKFIEPRKQVKHPYNGGRPPPGSPQGTKGDPEKTKPEWWPPGVMHREPDHLKKDQRLCLMVHIIRNLGRHGVTADKLKEVAYDAKRQLNAPEKMEVLDEIFRVRKLEERFERDEVDAGTVIHIVNRQPNAKHDRDSDFSEPEQLGDRDDAEDIEEEGSSPLSSLGQKSGLLASPVHALEVPQRITSVDLTNERNHLFEMTGSVKFEEQSMRRSSFQSPQSTAKADFGEDSFSPQAMVRSSTVSTGFRSSEPSNFDYLTQATFTSSIPEVQVRPQARLQAQQPPSPFQSWSSFNPNIFNPVDFSASSTRSVQQQMSFTYQPEVSPHQAHSSHSLPDLHVPRTQPQLGDVVVTSPPFRNGSLGHLHGLPH
ncbi:hypothetical protein Egran_04904 [Elaphomyces granulatus]|uniref:Subtelomeric hrmA-associated cluster protein AFUB-079030/YDR124W-like helical bundle domain-containing protein n=1 Tax=Elaphomyces granulatus TaxID=519963 RepID=A0A232LT21_9EURO|nr:hypothetical protein Egran_04904 [Elaphomyces granulatus]